MAVATKPKTKRVTSQTIRENRNKDNSPKWDEIENLTEIEFNKKFRDAMDWYRLDCPDKSLKPKVIDWMGQADYEKTVIQLFKDTKDNRCSQTMGAIAACLLKGMPAQRAGFNKGQNTENWLKEKIEEVLQDGKNDFDDLEEDTKTKKVETPVVTIQDRLRDASSQMTEEIDNAIDEWIKDSEKFDLKAFKIVNLLRGKGAKAAHARFIKLFYEPTLAEFSELQSKECEEQLAEAYSYHSKKNLKKMYDFLVGISTACDQIINEAKLNKPVRSKKVKPAEEIVKNLKFKASDDKLGITSVPPTQLIGAQAAVVYNTKTRKIGVYHAKNISGFTVKGSTIENFTEKSMQKTLRKPDIQLREFKDQNTQKRAETWINNIRATEIKLNGRINTEIMILKVYK